MSRARLEAFGAARDELAAGGQLEDVGHDAGNRPCSRVALCRRRRAGSNRAALACRDAAGCGTARSTGAISWILPPYITATRSHVSATTARLCVIRRIAASGAPLLQLQHQVQDLRLDRDVERRGRLVGDEQRRVQHERHGDHHALALAAGQLVRILRHARAPASGMPTSVSISTARRVRLVPATWLVLRG